MNIIFLGPPGSGKDTQALILRDKYGFTVISGGEALREEVERGGPNSETIMNYMNSGLLVPENITQDIVREYIKSKGVKDRLAFTGSVRSVPQLEFLDTLTSELGGKVDAVFYLKLSDEMVSERVKGRLYAPSSDMTYHTKFKPPKVAGKDDITGEDLVKRPDDHPAAVLERLHVFYESLPAIEAEYKSRGIWYELDAGLPIDEVQSKIEDVLKLDKQSGQL